MSEVAADVIIVGGGIMGAATAFFLRQRGRSVILLERGLVGEQASGVNFGNVRREGRSFEEVPLSNRSLDIWGRLPELIGEDVEFLPTGYMRVCFRKEDAAALEAYVREARDRGLALEMISANALRARYPHIGPDAVAGCLAPDDGHANPRIATPAFARAAIRAGAVVRQNAEVVSIEKHGEDFSVETRDGGRFRAPVVQISAGVWAGAMAERFGEPVPLSVRGPQMAVTEPVPYTVHTVLGFMGPEPESAVYLRQIPRGNVIYGGGLRGPAFADIRRAYVDPANILRQMPYVRRLVPAVARLRTIRTWSGIESYLPDDLPTMGPSAKVAGLYYAFGFCGHGFALGPGVGDTMAELIDKGQTRTPIAAFNIARFAAAAPPG